MMKKQIIIAGTFLVAFIAMSFLTGGDNKYPDALPIEHVEMFKADFLKRIDNTALTGSIGEKFLPLFDEITFIDAQKNEDLGFYYLVVGKKNKSDVARLLKVTDEEIAKEEYTYIDFTNIKVYGGTQYCAEGPPSSPYPFVCTGPCAPNLSGCIGIICGVYINGRCQIY